MLRSFLLVSLRNIAKYKVSSAISSGSLAIGILFAFVIFKFTAFERSFDRWVPDVHNKVRLNFKILTGGNTTVHAATSPYPFTDLFVPQTPEISAYARFFDAGEGILSYDDRIDLKTRGIGFADESLLDFFGVDLIKGSSIDDNDLKSVVISSSLANSIFGDVNPLDKTITYLGRREFVVAGVFEDLPANSSINFHFIAPMDNLQDLRPLYFQEGQNWGGYSFHTYYQLVEGTSIALLTDKLNQLYYDRFEIDDEDMEGEVFDFELISMADIHLNSGIAREQNQSGSEAKISMLEYLSFIILVIAWINFINLQATKAPQRMKEIGVRRVFGAVSRNLYLMFFLEFGLLNVMSFGVATALLWFLNPHLTSLAGVNVIPSILPMGAHPALFPTIVAGVLISSIYPAIVTIRSGARIKSTQATSGNFFRKGLVTMQFAVSLFMIAYTLTVYYQVRHMTNQNPGFDSSKVLMIEGPVTRAESNRQQAEFVKEQVLRLPGVELATWGGASPGVNQGWQGNIREMDSPESLFQTAYFSNITNDYFDVFGVEVLAGRIPDQDSPHDETRVIVNAKALEGWGWATPDEAIGKRIGYGSGSTVVGVVEDFNSIGFQSGIDPRVFIVDHLYQAQTANNYLLLKIDPKQLSTIIQSIQETYEAAFPGNPFEYSFLNEEFQNLYASEMAYHMIFSLFSMLAIALACVGMLGLARYSAINRRREIGIRKVLGSGEIRIVRLFLKEYLGLILLASVLSSPVAYLFIRQWLEGFAYRIEIGPELFLLPLIGLLVLTMITVGSISYKASLTDPVKVLKEL